MEKRGNLVNHSYENYQLAYRFRRLRNLMVLAHWHPDTIKWSSLFYVIALQGFCLPAACCRRSSRYSQPQRCTQAGSCELQLDIHNACTVRFRLHGLRYPYIRHRRAGHGHQRGRGQQRIRLGRLNPHAVRLHSAGWGQRGQCAQPRLQLWH